MNLRNQLSEMGLTLPEPGKPAAQYAPVAQSDFHLYVSGQLPMASGEMLAKGRVGDGVDLETAQACARQCALNALALIDQAVGGDWKVKFEQIVRIGVFVASTPEFTDHHLVANGASELLEKALGSRGRHARAAVGCVSLPLNAPVEVEVLVRLRNEDRDSD